MGKILSSAEIGWKLKIMRQQAGFTQERLAEAIGITSQQIQKYESGSNTLNADRLQQLAQVLNVSVQSFFSEGDEAVPLEVSERLLLDSYRAIVNKDIQDCIVKIAAHAKKVQD